jgi:hypothetical protein
MLSLAASCDFYAVIDRAALTDAGLIDAGSTDAAVADAGTTDASVPDSGAGLSDPVRLSLGPGSFGTCVELASGRTRCWGYNNYFQLAFDAGMGVSHNPSNFYTAPIGAQVQLGSTLSCAFFDGGVTCSTTQQPLTSLPSSGWCSCRSAKTTPAR